MHLFAAPRLCVLNKTNRFSTRAQPHAAFQQPPASLKLTGAATYRYNSKPLKARGINTYPFTSTGHSNLDSKRASPKLDHTPELTGSPIWRYNAGKSNKTICAVASSLQGAYNSAETYKPSSFAAHLVHHCSQAKCASEMGGCSLPRREAGQAVEREALFHFCWRPGARMTGFPPAREARQAGRAPQQGCRDWSPQRRKTTHLGSNSTTKLI